MALVSLTNGSLLIDHTFDKSTCDHPSLACSRHTHEYRQVHVSAQQALARRRAFFRTISARALRGGLSPMLPTNVEPLPSIARTDRSGEILAKLQHTLITGLNDSSNDYKADVTRVLRMLRAWTEAPTLVSYSSSSDSDVFNGYGLLGASDDSAGALSYAYNVHHLRNPFSGPFSPHPALNHIGHAIIAERPRFGCPIFLAVGSCEICGSTMTLLNGLSSVMEHIYKCGIFCFANPQQPLRIKAAKNYMEHPHCTFSVPPPRVDNKWPNDDYPPREVLLSITGRVPHLLAMQLPGFDQLPRDHQEWIFIYCYMAEYYSYGTNDWQLRGVPSPVYYHCNLPGRAMLHFQHQMPQAFVPIQPALAALDLNTDLDMDMDFQWTEPRTGFVVDNESTVDSSSIDQQIYQGSSELCYPTIGAAHGQGTYTATSNGTQHMIDGVLDLPYDDLPVDGFPVDDLAADHPPVDDEFPALPALLAFPYAPSAIPAGTSSIEQLNSDTDAAYSLELNADSPTPSSTTVQPDDSNDFRHFPTADELQDVSHAEVLRLYGALRRHHFAVHRH